MTKNDKIKIGIASVAAAAALIVLLWNYVLGSGGEKPEAFPEGAPNSNMMRPGAP